MSKAHESSNSETFSPLPYGNLTHEDINRAFCTVLNIVEPNNPYLDNDVYPVTQDEVEYGYKKSTSSLYASCGPKRNRRKPVTFSADKKYFNNAEPERILAILTHEVTHVTVGSHSNVESGSHPPRFWREFGFNAHLVLDGWETIRETFGDVSKRDFIGYIVREEVNSYNIDQRYGSVTLRRQEMARWFESTLK